MRKVALVFALISLAVLVSGCGGLAATAEPVAMEEASEGGPSTGMDDAGVEYAEEEALAEEPTEEPPALPMPAATMVGDMGGGEEEVPLEVPQAGNPPDGMFFEDYGTNPFTDASQDNLSTFAVDVDTGSYTLARNYLNDYILPPPEAIRLEEFINYFEQDYPIPQQDAFSIYMEAASTPFNAQGNYVMRVGIQGYEVPPEERPDATLIFVIDVSGSMDRGDRLEAVKQALYALVDELRPTDQIGIVVYGSVGRVLLEPTPVQRSSQIVLAIDALAPDGSTNAEEGLRLAYEMATAHYDAGRINRLILCSDGVANVGVTGPDVILEVVRQQAREGITLTTVGFGMGNYNDVLMEQLADDGDGQYFYVDTQDEAERVFVEDLTGTLLTIGKNAKIQVEFSPEAVAYYRLMGYENRDVADEDFRRDDVDAGEIGAGHSVTALYEIVPAEQAPAQAVVATVYLRWEDPDTGEVTEITRSLSVQDVHRSFEDASPRFRLDATVAAFADVLGEGAWAQVAPLSRIYEVARQIAEELPGDEDVQELVNLIAIAMGLVE